MEDLAALVSLSHQSTELSQTLPLSQIGALYGATVATLFPCYFPYVESGCQLPLLLCLCLYSRRKVRYLLVPVFSIKGGERMCKGPEARVSFMHLWMETRFREEVGSGWTGGWGIRSFRVLERT